jgi:hypothetical protein
MRDQAKKFENYLYENLGITSRLEPWRDEGSLPPFLHDLYHFYQCQLLDEPCLIMAAQGKEEITPVTIRKHIGRIEKVWGHEVIYLHPAISSYNRKRLIEQKISFVVPGNQMYLPILGMDLRKHIRSIRTARRKFSPSTQVLLLSVLYEWPEHGVTPSQVAERLGYSAMTLTRAFDEIEAAGLGNVHMEWRERVLRFEEDRKTLWESALGQLHTPVRKRVHALAPHAAQSLVLAGESALARYSMLADPANPVYAVTLEAWKAMRLNDDVTELSLYEPGSVEIEIWKYAPELFAQNRVVDPLSLFLSLKDTKDERVEMALDALMGNFEWQ